MQNRNLKKEKTCILAYIQICFHTYSQIHLYQLTKSCVNYKNVVVVKKSKKKKKKICLKFGPQTSIYIDVVKL